MRRWLVVFLAAAAALLSFDALRAHALDSGVIPQQAILPRDWLAALWALVIDAAAAAGILGVRADRRDWRAWLMLALAFTASVGFQVWTPPTEVARAVPPVVLALAIVVLELPRKTAEPAATGAPSPAPVAPPPVGERGATAGAGTGDAAPVPAPAPAPRERTTARARRGATPHATVGLTKADLVALDRAMPDPAALERAIVRRGIDRGSLPPRHVAALNGSKP